MNLQAVAGKHVDHQWNGQHGERRQHRIEHKQGNHHPENGDDRDEEFHQIEAEKIVDAACITGQAADDAAGGTVVIEVESEPVQMDVHIVAQIFRQALPQSAEDAHVQKIE